MILEFRQSPFSNRAWGFFKNDEYLGTLINRTGQWKLYDGYFEQLNSADYRQIAAKLDELNGVAND